MSGDGRALILSRQIAVEFVLTFHNNQPFVRFMTLDIDFIRAQFPAFSQPTVEGKAFFESAAGSFPCRFVIDRFERFYRERKVQPYAPYELSQIAGQEMDEAQNRLSAMMGVEADELSFGPSTTQNTYVLANAFRQWLSTGDAIVVTNQDHEANSGPWRRLADEGIEVREWKVDPVTGSLDPETLRPLLKGAKLLCFPHCSNVVAEINDVATICALAREEGAVTCVDGVSYAPHGFPNMQELGADIYLFSSYKTYGPHQGLMLIQRALAEALPNQGHYFNAGYLTKRFTPAGPDHAQVAACAGMADYVDALFEAMGKPQLDAVGRCAVVHEEMRAREVSLAAPLLDYLGGRNDVRLIGPDEAARRAPTVALLCERRASELAVELAHHGVMADGGDFYAVRPLQALGIEPDHGVLRLSFTHYTHEDEIAHLIRALDQVL